MNTNRKQLLFALILVLVFIASILNALVKMGLIYSEISGYIIEIPSEVAWTTVMLFMLYLFTSSEIYEPIYNRKANNRALFFCIIAVAIMSISGTCGVGTMSPLLFNCGPIVILLAGLIGGPKVSIPSAAIAAVIIHLTTAFYVAKESFMYLVVLLIFAVISGYMAKDGYHGKRKSCIAVIMCMVVITILGVIADLTKYYDFESGEPELLSFLVLFILCFVSIWVFDEFQSILTSQKDNLSNKEDLRLAHEIQMTSVPHEFPDSHSMDIHAFMEPAKEVGGDFYDCIQVSRNLTLFVVADVSDKGLPASLLMMRSMGIIRAAAMNRSDPGSVLTTFNKELSVNNPANQFVSVWAGLYDSDTGVLCYSNAGHPAPFIYREGEGFSRLPVKKAPVVGVIETIHYKTDKIQLRDKDKLFVFTDGVNEAFDKDEEQLGVKGLERILNVADLSSSVNLIESVKTGLNKHVGDIPMADDVTMLCLMVDRSWYNMITVPGKVEELDNVNAFISKILYDAGCPEKDILKMEIVSEEIFVNICDHAYSDSEGSVDVYCGYHDGEVKLTFADTASAFNPINKEDIAIDDDVGNWPIGGFGIHMVKNLVTYMDYKNYAGMNIFTVWKKIGKEKGQ